MKLISYKGHINSQLYKTILRVVGGLWQEKCQVVIVDSLLFGKNPQQQWCQSQNTLWDGVGLLRGNPIQLRQLRRQRVLKTRLQCGELCLRPRKHRRHRNVSGMRRHRSSAPTGLGAPSTRRWCRRSGTSLRRTVSRRDRTSRAAIWDPLYWRRCSTRRNWWV